ncbi:MAG: CHRD domain-containing protein [Pyrinomonadaceae bacterium]|nr:CHRD domain-containing protein [Pyrinomonadaceae bacterium]
MKFAGVLAVFAILIFGTTSAFSQKDTGRKLTTALTGAAEVPGPGDTDGTGTATIRLNQGKNQICWELTVSNIATATGAHIHEAAAGAAGPVLVTLTTPDANGTSSGCVDADAELIKRIRQSPELFYVNVHNAEFADGAVRGQLSKKP